MHFTIAKEQFRIGRRLFRAGGSYEMSEAEFREAGPRVREVDRGRPYRDKAVHAEALDREGAQ